MHEDGKGSSKTTISWKVLSWKVQYEIGMNDVRKFQLKVTVEVGKFTIKLERIIEFGKLLMKLKKSIEVKEIEIVFEFSNFSDNFPSSF